MNASFIRLLVVFFFSLETSTGENIFPPLAKPATCFFLVLTSGKWNRESISKPQGISLYFQPFSSLYICISLSLSVLFTLFTEKEYCSFNLVVTPPPPPMLPRPPPLHLGVVMFPFSGSCRELYCSPRYLPTSIHAKSLFI